MITAHNPCTTGSDDTGKSKMETGVVDGQNKAISFVKQCIKICSQGQGTRNRGVLTPRKSKKRVQNNKMEKRFYHFQEFDKVGFQNTKFDEKIFEEGALNAIMGRCNLFFMLTWVLVIVQIRGFCALVKVALVK